VAASHLTSKPARRKVLQIINIMRTSAAITLIICGTVLILTPHIVNTIGTNQIAHLIEATQRPDASLNGSLSPSFNTWTVIIGILMVIFGTIGASKARN
jgi:hypothetical protein